MNRDIAAHSLQEPGKEIELFVNTRGRKGKANIAFNERVLYPVNPTIGIERDTKIAELSINFRGIPPLWPGACADCCILSPPTRGDLGAIWGDYTPGNSSSATIAFKTNRW
jgi:hypothetical protein